MSNDKQWLRSHDALIAERAEGLALIQSNYTYWSSAKERWQPIPHYLTDLAAIARAQEAWRLQEPKKRRYFMYSPVGPDDKFDCECHTDLPGDDLDCFIGEADIEPAARAWATWRACGGVE